MISTCIDLQCSCISLKYMIYSISKITSKRPNPYKISQKYRFHIVKHIIHPLKNTWVYIISDFAKCHWQGNPTGLPSWESHRIVHPRCPTMVHHRITRCKTMVKQVVTPVSHGGSRDGYCNWSRELRRLVS